MNATDLLTIPLFSRLGATEASALAPLLESRKLAANEVLFWVGEPGREFFVIQQGRIQVCYPDYAGKEMTLAVLGPGDFLGEIALLDGGPRTATARAAAGGVEVLSLGREHFQQFVTANPSAALHIMGVLGRRQRETVERLRGIRNINEVVLAQETTWQRLAETFAAAAASHWFILGHGVAFGAWIVANLMLHNRAPDPFPFPFLCSWATVEAIFLSMFIIVSQNFQTRKERIRTDIEYQVALKMQVEIMQLHQKIDRLPEEVLAKIHQQGLSNVPAQN